MELAKTEIAAVEVAALEATEIGVQELNELQLALVGGGCADPLFK